MKFLVTGGAGFIGSCFILQRIADGDSVLNLDKLTYAGNFDNLATVSNHPNYFFIHGDIADKTLSARLFKEFKPDVVINFAAESHVDRSILDPDAFLQTNVIGTCSLLSETLRYWQNLEQKAKENFRFLHISTDEVFGSLTKEEPPFTEMSQYKPNSPYSASKASADHFVRAFNKTYGLPTLITHCSNNYGPRQYPEKLIPLIILNALAGKELPIYGDGSNIRDWIHVEDHCSAIDLVVRNAAPGAVYNIGGNSEFSNLKIVREITEILDEVNPRKDGCSYFDQVRFVKDRPGHDFRYAINSNKIFKELGWRPSYSFHTGLRETVVWYLNNPRWIKNVKNKHYSDWMKLNYDCLLYTSPSPRD